MHAKPQPVFMDQETHWKDCFDKLQCVRWKLMHLLRKPWRLAAAMSWAVSGEPQAFGGMLVNGAGVDVLQGAYYS